MSSTRTPARRNAPLFLFAILVSLAAPAIARAGGINLSWDDCGAAGTAIKTFACEADAKTPHAMIGSFVSDETLPEFLGLTADLRIGATTLPDWWKHGSGQCRGTNGLSVGFAFDSDACADFWQGHAVGGSIYELDAFGPNTARLRLLCAVPFDSRGQIDAGTEYYAFRALLIPNRVAGAGSCAGCADPVAITLENVQLAQPPEQNNDPILTEPIVRNTIYWQAETGGLPAITSFAPAAGAPGAIVTIQGSGLGGAYAVRFGGIDAQVETISETVIEAIVPVDARSGPIEVETSFGRARSASSFQAPPVIQSFLPAGAPVGFGVTIRGFNFLDATAVRFGGASASFVAASDSVITTTVPPGAQTGPIEVVNSTGTAITARTFFVGPALGAMNLSWNDCGRAGQALQTFACNSNTGDVFELVGSFVPPVGVDRLTSMQADLRVAAETLPDWWKHGPVQCRGSGALQAITQFTDGACKDPWIGRAIAGPIGYEIGRYGPNTARLRVTATVQNAGTVALDAREEYYGFRVLMSPIRTTGVPSCAGCADPVTISLAQIQLFQKPEAGHDPVIITTLDRSVVHWQAEPGPAPEIDSFDPLAGGPGAVVTIRGSYLAAAHSVEFQGQSAVFSVVSDGELRATVPPGARTGPIRVASLNGTATSAAVFIVAPRVTSFVPRVAPAGHTVEIRGVNFTAVSAVAFNGVPASFEEVSETVLRAVVPANAANGPISVTNPGGSGVSNQDFIVGPLPQPPVITALTPPAGEPGDVVRISGRNFIDVVRITYNDQVTEPGTSTDTTIFAPVPAGARTGTFRVVTEHGEATSPRFIVAPVVQGITPTSGPVGAVVEVSGYNFADVTQVRFGTRIAPFEIVSDALIRATVPLGVADDPIVVVNAGGESLSPQSFRFESETGPNLVRNPSFEFSTAFWSPVLHPTFARVADAHHGAWALEVSSRSDSLREFGVNDSPNTVVASPAAGRTYRFQAWLKSKTGGVEAQLRIREYADRTRLQTAVSRFVTLGNDWTPIQVEIQTQAAGTALDFQVIGHPFVVGARLLLDDVSIRVVGSGPIVDAPAERSASAGTPFEMEVGASDPTGAPIQSLVADLGGLPARHDAAFTLVGEGRGVLRWTPKPEDAGSTYEVRFRATSILTTEHVTRITVAGPAEPNLVGNPSFEGTTAGWRGYEGGVLSLTSPGHTGASALHVQGPSDTADGFGVNDHSNWVRDTGPVPGRRYRFSAWVRAVSGGGKVYLKVREYLGPTRIGAVTYSEYLIPGPEWRQVWVDHVTGAAGSTLDLQIQCAKAEPGAAFLVDDVVIRVVEPAAVAKAAEATAMAAAAREGDVVFDRPIAFPSPFRDRATLAMTLPKAGPLQVELFDLHGRRVKRVVDREVSAGTHRFEIDRAGERGERLGAGMYFYRVQGVAGAAHGRIVILD